MGLFWDMVVVLKSNCTFIVVGAGWVCQGWGGAYRKNFIEVFVKLLIGNLVGVLNMRLLPEGW